ncbi:MAG: DinB family protein [Armatimonadota bacterium]
MTDHFQKILTSQFEAALAMLKQCVEACPPQHYEGKIANDTFRTIAYHTLFWVDYYLSPGEHAFELRDVNHRGGDDRITTSSPGLSRDETLSYVEICRRKLVETLAAETAESLAAPSGFSRFSFSRGELHLYNLRHIQHHTGALSAYLRRVDASVENSKALSWVRMGWR